MCSFRRDIKWEGRDDSSDQAKWNSSLLESLVPICYSSLLSHLAQDGEPHLQYWPNPAQKSGDFTDWTTCMELCQEMVVNKPCLITLSGDIVTPTSSRVEIYGGIGTAEESSVVKLFLSKLDNEVIVDLSDEKDQHVLSALLRVSEKPQMSAAALADICRRNVDIVKSLENEDKLVVLKLLANRPGTHLAGLPLLPLRSGLWGTVQPGSNAGCFFLASAEMDACIPSSFKNVVTIPGELDTLARGWANSKQFGIRVASVGNLASILKQAFPQSWVNSVESVDWIPEEPTQPTVENMRHIWKVLNSSNVNLADFKDIPILPDQPFNHQHSEQRMMLTKPAGRWLDCSQSPQKLTTLVEKLSNWKVLTWDPVLHLPALASYRSRLDASVLLSIFEKNRDNIKSLLETDRQLCTEVIDLVTRDPKFTTSPALKDKMLSFPIFRTIDDQPIALKSRSLDTTHYVARSYMTSIDDFLINTISREGHKVILCGTPSEEKLAAHIFSLPQLTERSAQDLVIKIIQRHPGNQTSSLIWILKNLPRTRWGPELNNTAFLPSNGQLFKMSELFVSTDKKLSLLLQGDQFCFIDQDSPLNKFEKEMGSLKTMADITLRDVTRVGEVLSRKAPEEVNMDKLQILLDVALESGWMPKISHLNLLPSMQRPQWLPQNFPWKAKNPMLHPAADLLKSSYAEVAGCVSLVVHPSYTQYLEATTMQMKLTPEILLQQLECFVTRKMSSWDQGLEKLMTEIDSAANDARVLNMMRGKLEKIGAWVPTQDGFRAVDEVSLSSVDVRNFHPYISSPKEIIQRLRNVQNLGIKTHLEMSDKLTVLTKIREKYEGKKATGFDENWKNEDRVIVNVCNGLDENFLKNNTILLPILQHNELKFEDTKKIYWDDVSSEAKKELLQDIKNEYPIVHLKTISPDLAMKLRLTPVTENLLDMTHLDPSFEEFSQHQSMTNRIKEILREYPVDGPVLFQEQIQNSEDAGATTVKFLLDTNDNRDFDKTLLGETMKACNGESLWIYNDAQFSEEDFENILNVGGATKKEKTDKIGSFGIGFNSVFHLTDVPSIVSGKHF